jgi:DNA (cytosine-5)-methyltransferase 1
VFGDQAGTLTSDGGTGNTQAIAFSAKDHGADAGETAPTLRAGGHLNSHANAGVMPAIAFTLHGADKTVSTATETNLAGSVRTKPPGSIENSSTTAVLQATHVRRLTPTECERLQGFPDDHTRVPYRNKPASQCPDGPRYKALGNSMAVPCIGWVLARLKATHELLARAAA